MLQPGFVCLLTVRGGTSIGIGACLAAAGGLVTPAAELDAGLAGCTDKSKAEGSEEGLLVGGHGRGRTEGTDGEIAGVGKEGNTETMPSTFFAI